MNTVERYICRLMEQEEKAKREKAAKNKIVVETNEFDGVFAKSAKKTFALDFDNILIVK